jgi:CRISPR-associated protein Csm4
MQAIILKCPPNGRFHFGITAPDVDSALSSSSICFHSDTLFSALVILCNRMFPDRVNELIQFFNNQEIQISSGSYCLEILQENEPPQRVFFLPKPSQFDAASLELADRKAVKGIEYISKTIWEKGIPPDEWLSTNECSLIDRKFLVHEDELSGEVCDLIEGFYKIKTEPKIADHARKKTNNIFFQTDLFLKTNYLREEDITIHQVECLFPK